MKQKPVLFILLIFLSAIIYVNSVGFASEPDALIIAKPFGPSVEVPDPAKGYNGWYMNEAGVTETLFALDFDMNLKPWLAESFKNISPLQDERSQGTEGWCNGRRS